MKKIVLSVLVSIYLILTLFVTTCLLSYNEYNVPEVFNKIIIVSKDINNYNNGSLIIIDKNKEYKTNEEIFYYDSYVPSLKVDSSLVVSIEKITETEDTLLLENGRYLSSEFVIGNSFTTIPLIGYVISVMSSKIGYIACVILPTLLVLIYGLVKIIRINKKGKKEDEK